MRFLPLVWGSFLAMGAMAQAPFSNSSASSSVPSVTGGSTFTPLPTPAGTTIFFKLSISGVSGGFQCRENVGIFFNTAITAAQGDQFNLGVAGTLQCAQTTISFAVFVQIAASARKRQAGVIHAIGVSTVVPATAFTTTFGLSASSVLTLANSGVSYGFALSAAGLLVAYPLGTSPAGVTVVTIVAIGANGAPAVVPATPTSTVTVTSTVAAVVTSIVNNVDVSVNVVVSVIVAPITTTSVTQVIAVPFNGFLVYFSSLFSYSTLTTYLSFGSVTFGSATSVVVVRVVSVVIPAGQVIVVGGKTTTLTVAVTTVGLITTVQAPGLATTTVITVVPATTVTIPATTTITAAGAVGTKVVTVVPAAPAAAAVTPAAAPAAAAPAAAAPAAAAPAAATTAAALPVVSTLPKASAAGKVETSAFALAIFAAALAIMA